MKIDVVYEGGEDVGSPRMSQGAELAAETSRETEPEEPEKSARQADAAERQPAGERPTASLPDQPAPPGSRELGKSLREACPREAHAAWEPLSDRPDPLALLLGWETGRPCDVGAGAETAQPAQPDGPQPDANPLLPDGQEPGPDILDLLGPSLSRMASGQFSYFCGAAPVMAADLARTPSTGLLVQALGDAAIDNFALSVGPDGRLVLDMLDFSQTAPAPWEWDVKRLAASVEALGRESGLSPKQRADAVEGCAKAYRKAMRSFAKMSGLEVRAARLDADKLVGKLGEDALWFSEAPRPEQPSFCEDAELALRALRASLPTMAPDGRYLLEGYRVVGVADLSEANPGAVRGAASAEASVEEDAAEAGSAGAGSAGAGSAGAGSAGAGDEAGSSKSGCPDGHGTDGGAGETCGRWQPRRWAVLLEGAGPWDTIELLVEEERESVLERYTDWPVADGLADTVENLSLPGEPAGSAENPSLPGEPTRHARRVAEGQRAAQASDDIFLGWCQLADDAGAAQTSSPEARCYAVRQMPAMEWTLDLGELGAGQLRQLAKACAWTLARAHARTGDRVAIAFYLGKSPVFDEAVAEFAREYADQNACDYERFLEALGEGSGECSESEPTDCEAPTDDPPGDNPPGDNPPGDNLP